MVLAQFLQGPPRVIFKKERKIDDSSVATSVNYVVLHFSSCSKFVCNPETCIKVCGCYLLCLMCSLTSIDHMCTIKLVLD